MLDLLTPSTFVLIISSCLGVGFVAPVITAIISRWTDSVSRLSVACAFVGSLFGMISAVHFLQVPTETLSAEHLPLPNNWLSNGPPALQQLPWEIRVDHLSAF